MDPEFAIQARQNLIIIRKKVFSLVFTLSYIDECLPERFKMGPGTNHINIFICEIGGWCH